MKGQVTLPNIITSGNLIAGFIALLVVQTNLAVAAVLVGLGAVFDWLDGVAARRRTGGSTFGANLDSLADLVTFGVTPAMTLYVGALQAFPGVGLVVAAGFVLCGAWRLARFPLVKTTSRFVGFPIPPAGVLIMLLMLAGPPPLLALLVALALSALMVSTLAVPTLASAYRSASRGAIIPLTNRRPPERAPRRACGVADGLPREADS